MKLPQRKHDSDYERLAQRMAALEDKLLGVLERNTQLEKENGSLRRA